MSGVAGSLEKVRRRIASACDRAARHTSSVTLVAVSKTFSSDHVEEALAAGQAVFGENRVQEALAKIDLVSPRARWHLVGHLQRNKARHAAGSFELIHSLDGPELARELDKRSASAGIVQPVLIQLNVACEATKHGASEDAIEGLLDAVLPLEHLDVRGLMTIPPWVENAEDNRHHFARLRELRDRCASRSGRPLPELSMGMTDDFEVAIEEGATLVRVGRAIFGERPGAG